MLLFYLIAQVFLLSEQNECKRLCSVKTVCFRSGKLCFLLCFNDVQLAVSVASVDRPWTVFASKQQQKASLIFQPERPECKTADQNVISSFFLNDNSLFVFVVNPPDLPSGYKEQQTDLRMQLVKFVTQLPFFHIFFFMLGAVAVILPPPTWTVWRATWGDILRSIRLCSCWSSTGEKRQIKDKWWVTIWARNQKCDVARSRWAYKKIWVDIVHSHRATKPLDMRNEILSTKMMKGTGSHCL